MVLGPRESPVPFCVIIKISLIRNSTLCNLKHIKLMWQEGTDAGI